MATANKPETKPTTATESADEPKVLTPRDLEPVRVKDKDLGGAHRTVKRFIADSDAKRFTVLDDHEAVNRNGFPLPVKPNTTAKTGADQAPENNA